MSALVGYASSDEDEVEIEAQAQQQAFNGNVSSDTLHSDDATRPRAAPSPAHDTGQASSEVVGPAYPRPATPEQEQEVLDDDGPALSPYSANRAQLQSLTMPRHPNFDIPSSPSPPPANSEDAAELTARTRKIEHFLELKKQGIHFNDRLASSQALRNPQMLQKLADFAGIEPEEQYENTLGQAFAVPTRWPAGFLENLVASNERKLKKDKQSRTKLDFVPGKKSKT